MSNWSSRRSEQYHLYLPADVVAWFDGEFWKVCSETGFGQPVHVPKAPKAAGDRGREDRTVAPLPPSVYQFGQSEWSQNRGTS